MSLVPEIVALLHDSASADVRPDESSERVWHLTYPSLLGRQSGRRREHVDAVKRKLLEMVIRTGMSVIHHPDSPQEEQLPGTWLAGRLRHSWRVPPDLNLAEESVAYWLFSLGNWVICAPEATLDPPIDLARAPVTELLAWLEAQRADIVIDSFHDDVSWVVLLASQRVAT